MFGFGNRYSKERFDDLETGRIKAEGGIKDSGEILEGIAHLSSESELNRALYRSDEEDEKRRLEEKQRELARIKAEEERLLRLAEEEAHEEFKKAA
ncbi:MAG: hypothetical protein ACYC1K_02725 [Minisyncoccota bacterium]